MDTYSGASGIRKGASPPRPFSTPGQKGISALIRPLFGLCCWSAVVWVAWNHALADFLDAGGVGPLQALAIGTILYALSVLFDDTEPGWGEEIPENPFRIK